MSTLRYIEVAPSGDADACVIWLHGLGASGHDFEPIVPHLGLPKQHRIRFLFPHAPEIPVTVNNGMVMPAWYNILEMNLQRKVDTVQLQQSADAISALVNEQIEQGIDSRRIVLAGFSQGGAVAYQCAYAFDQPLAGVVAMSTYIAAPENLQIHPFNSQLSTQVHHGVHDPVVPEQLGQAAVQTLKSHGIPVEYFSYPLDHSVNLEEIVEIGRFLTAQLAS